MDVNLPPEFLEGVFYAFFFALIRCSIFIATLPLVGSKSLPDPVKVMLIFVLSVVGAYIILPNLNDTWLSPEEVLTGNFKRIDKKKK